MAVPKRKTSKARRDKRRANWKLAVPGLVKCPNCSALIKSHHVCPECGMYNGKRYKCEGNNRTFKIRSDSEENVKIPSVSADCCSDTC